MHIVRYLPCIKQILLTDLKSFKPVLLDKVIDLTVWVTLLLWVSTYILPHLGMNENYGVFMLGSMIAAGGIFESYPIIFDLISDFERDHITYYYATLPLPTWMIFARLIMYYAIISGFMAALVIPVSLPILWHNIHLMNINWLIFGIIFFSASIFYGALSLFIASFVRNSSQMGSVWTRIIFPLWFLGGFQFSWQALYNAVPWFAYVSLINPILHISEAYRSTIIAVEPSIPVTISMVYLLAITLIMSVIAIKRLKRRLDFI